MQKEKVLALLEAQSGRSVSGEALAKELGLSRAAVWKMVRALRAEGFPIEGKTNAGYCLSPQCDVLLESEISRHLNGALFGKSLLLFSTVDSTNDVLRRLAFEHAAEGTVVLAEEQTAGRGRQGRSFHSPCRNGIYMSVLLRPQLPFARIHFLTMLAAVCVTNAIFTVSGVSVQIKWVNDLLLGGKKLCGILSEGAVEGESGTLSFVVLGIGLNVGSTQAFPALPGNVPAALREAAQKPFTRNALVAEILNELERLYIPYVKTQDTAPFLQSYRAALCLIGQKVQVLQGDTTYCATVTGLLEDGSLCVMAEDGTCHTLRSGEVSLRPQTPA